MFICVIGTSHHSTPLALRERLSYSNDSRAAALHMLKRQYAEVVILDTCHRSEVYCVAHDAGDTRAALSAFVCAFHALDAHTLEPHLYFYTQHDAIAHLFAAASGIDSLVIGETQILSQVRSAFEFAAQHDACGIILSALFRHALHAGKRARSETDIARGATSLSSLAIEAARAHLGVLDRCRALIIGAGKMS